LLTFVVSIVLLSHSVDYADDYSLDLSGVNPCTKGVYMLLLSLNKNTLPETKPERASAKRRQRKSRKANAYRGAKPLERVVFSYLDPFR